MWDPFEFGLLPRLSGFHRKDYSKHMGEFGGGLVNGQVLRANAGFAFFV
jgi:hypothetical protein